MRNVIIAIVVIGIVAAAAIGMRAFMRTSLTGQLIDIACYSQDKENTGDHHKGRGLACARACALEGFPVGLLTSDGKVYQVTGDLTANRNEKLVDHMTHTVTITGDVTEKDGQNLIASSDLKMVHD